MALAPNKSKLRHTCAKIRAFLEDGKSHDEIPRLLGIDWETYEDLIKAFYEHETELIRNRGTEEIYVDYVREQVRNMRDLTTILDHFKESKQHSAMVGAVRARSEIYDKIIDRGQEFGFIDKKAETKLVAGVIVAQLTNKELRSAITEELGHLDRLMSRYGGEQNLRELTPDPVHLPTPKQKATSEKGKARRARNKVHAGRRVVRGQT